MIFALFHTVKAPSAIAFAETYPLPKEMTKEDIVELKDAFVSAVRRAKEVGVDFLQIHGAHGYLFHSKLSRMFVRPFPLTCIG